MAIGGSGGRFVGVVEVWHGDCQSLGVVTKTAQN